MLKTKDFFDTMIQTYCARENPNVSIGSVDQKQSEHYELQYVQGKIVVKAENPFGAILGWRRALDAIASGYIRENLGRRTPRFPLRVFQGSIDKAGEAIQHGYNAVVCTQEDDLSSFLEYGLKVILKLKEPIENLDGVYGIWVESELKEDDEYKTRIEMIEGDLARWEGWVDQRCQLIYQLCHGVDAIWVRWFLNLCIKAKKGTSLAFSTSCPDLLWERFRQNLDVIQTPLLVIMDQDNDLSDKLIDHVFAGGISMNSKPQFFIN